MTRDEIIKGLNWHAPTVEMGMGPQSLLQRIKSLVAQAETAEREECAKVAETMLRYYTQTATGVPQAIRARGDQTAPPQQAAQVPLDVAAVLTTADLARLETRRLTKLWGELGLMKWAGTDEGWDRAIEAVRIRLNDECQAVLDWKAKVDQINGGEALAHPPQRKPLTDEEIAEICMDCSLVTPSDIYFARAIERAHGIGGES
jgi:hypothetical protein